MSLWVIAALPLGAALVGQSSKARLAGILSLALLAFQSTEGYSAPKVSFFGLIIVVLAMELLQGSLVIPRATGLAVLILIVLSCASGLRGNSPGNVFRDSSNYLLLVTVAPLVAHFGRRLSSQTMTRFSIATGLVAAYSFAATWSGKRNLANLPKIGVSSSVLFGFIVALFSAIAVTSLKSRRWWAAAAVLIAAGILTGTRNLLLLMLPPLVIAVYANRSASGPQRARARRAVRRAVTVVPVVFAVALIAAIALSVDVSGAFSRIATVLDLGQSGASNSLIERQIQQDIAWVAFTRSPFIGSGPGTLWNSYRPTSDTTATAFTMDTSLVIFAKWGLIGGVALLVLIWHWWRRLRPDPASLNIWNLTALGLFPFFLAESILSAQIEDRGLPIALLLLGAGSLSHAREERKTGPQQAGETSAKPVTQPAMGVW